MYFEYRLAGSLSGRSQPACADSAAPLGSNGIGVALSHARVPVFSHSICSTVSRRARMGQDPADVIRHSDVSQVSGRAVKRAVLQSLSRRFEGQSSLSITYLQPVVLPHHDGHG
jgi:hypothetical protein